MKKHIGFLNYRQNPSCTGYAAAGATTTVWKLIRSLNEIVKIEFQEAEKADAREVSQLLRSLSKTYITSSFPAEGAAKLLESMNSENIGKYMDSGFRYIVAVSNGKIVGVVAMKGGCHLFHLFVASAHQGKGLGRKLWGISRQSSLETNAVEKFTVNSSENARGFYEKLGFKSIGEAVTVSGVTHHPMALQLDTTDK